MAIPCSIVFVLIFSVSSKPNTDSYEAESFIQSALQYTTSCQNSFQYMSVQDLVFLCNNQGTCSDGRDSCSVLNDTLKGLLAESWPVGKDFPTKAYKLDISSQSGGMVFIANGNATNNYKGAQQLLSQGSISINIAFTAYS